MLPDFSPHEIKYNSHAIPVISPRAELPARGKRVFSGQKQPRLYSQPLDSIKSERSCLCPEPDNSKKSKRPFSTGTEPALPPHPFSKTGEDCRLPSFGLSATENEYCQASAAGDSSSDEGEIRSETIAGIFYVRTVIMPR